MARTTDTQQTETPVSLFSWLDQLHTHTVHGAVVLIRVVILVVFVAERRSSWLNMRRNNVSDVTVLYSLSGGILSL